MLLSNESKYYSIKSMGDIWEGNQFNLAKVGGLRWKSVKVSRVVSWLIHSLPDHIGQQAKTGKEMKF